MSDAIADLEAWLAQAFSREHTGSYDGLKLEPVRRVVARLPAPPRPITVAGTKGKGSTVRLCEAILRAHELPTVAFTSPHVTALTERWRIDGAPVTLPRARAAAQQVASAEQAVGERLTYFERCFAIACVLAAEHAGTFLCEVGLGGRLDCSNVLDCQVAVLTHLSLDHVEVLGPDLDAIAREKLAIARHDAPLLIAPQSPAGRAAISARLPPAASVHWLEPLGADWVIGLPGAHQRGNAAAALAAAERVHAGLDPARTRAALAACSLAARCQLLSDGSRRLLIDGAHNEASLQATFRTAATLLADDFLVILGAATDKDLTAVCADLAASGRAVWRCGYAGPRARRRDQWPEPARAWPWFADIAAALAACEPGRDCCITGSFYLAGEALAELGDLGAAVPG